MSPIHLDPHVALVVIDLQKGIAVPPTVHTLTGILQNAHDLATAFRDHRLPVVLVNVAGRPAGRSELGGPAPRPEGWTELVHELDQQPSDLRVTKLSWGAFTATGLEQLLKDRDVTQVLLAGMATCMGVETTARQAFELGFNVAVAIDAITDRDPATHENSVERIFPKLAETGTTAEVISLLGGEQT